MSAVVSDGLVSVYQRGSGNGYGNALSTVYSPLHSANATERRSHRGGEDAWFRDAGRKRSRLSQHTHGYRADIDCEHSHPRFPPRLLIVLNHGHWLLLNIGRFSIDECRKTNSSYVKTRLIVTLLHPSPRRGNLVLRLGVEVARLVSLAQLARPITGYAVHHPAAASMSSLQIIHIDHDESLAFKNREGPASRARSRLFLIAS
jgi:hypothetical protein